MKPASGAQFEISVDGKAALLSRYQSDGELPRYPAKKSPAEAGTPWKAPAGSSR